MRFKIVATNPTTVITTQNWTTVQRMVRHFGPDHCRVFSSCSPYTCAWRPWGVAEVKRDILNEGHP